MPAQAAHLFQQRPDVHDFAGKGGRGHHRRAHEQRPTGRAALTALEIAVRRRGADLPAFEPVGVHRQAHRAAGAAPFEAGLGENLVQPLGLGRPAHRLRARHDERLDVRRDTCRPLTSRAASSRSDSRPLVHEPMKATSMRVPSTARAALESHEGQRFLVGAVANRFADPDRLAGVDAPRDGRLDRRRVERDAVVVARIRIRRDLPPPGDRAIERRAGRHEPPALEKPRTSSRRD